MQISPHKPAAVTLAVWRDAPFEVRFSCAAAAGSPVDLTGIVVGVTMAGLVGGASLTLRSDDAPESLTASAVWVADAPGGVIGLRMSAADAERVLVGRYGQWRLWLADAGGETPLIYGIIEGRDFA